MASPAESANCHKAGSSVEFGKYAKPLLDELRGNRNWAQRLSASAGGEGLGFFFASLAALRDEVLIRWRIQSRLVVLNH